MIIHSYTSGIAGFAANKEKDVSKKNKSFEVTYLGFFIMILFYSVHSYYFLYGNKLFLTLFENINLFRLADIKESLTKDEYKLYSLIWRRFIACRMKSAIYDTEKVTFDANSYTFNANSSKLAFQGFLIIYKNSDLVNF